MPTPRPGSSGYKGPVHEAVRNALGSIGVEIGKQKRAVSPPPRVRKIPLSEQAQNAKGNVRNATAAARNKGTYYNYDPLSSIQAPKQRRTRKPLNERPKYRRSGGKGDTP